MRRHFYALDLSGAVDRVSSSCHTCASLPRAVSAQSSDDPPEVVGQTFAADVIRRQRQCILVLRECTSSYTASCLIPDEKHHTLRDGLARLCIDLRPLDGPRAVIRVDPAPGYYL